MYDRRVAVSARAAKMMTAPARLGYRDVRGGSSAWAGTYPFEAGEEVVTGWHSHDLHQLEYAFEGVAEVETATARYLLPPQQAVWIPAGVEHCTTLTRVRTVSAFFEPDPGLGVGKRLRILSASPLIREMLLYARRWPIGRLSADPAADFFFQALLHLIEEALDQEPPLRLPTSRNPLVVAVMRFTVDNLAWVTLSDACAATGTSERSLRRAFAADTGMSWRQYLLQSRLLRAMALLAQPEPTALAIATSVGFASMSGFTRAFRRYTGETPSAYRQRVLPPPPRASRGH
jgi:AraC-like DNA-binding protein